MHLGCLLHLSQEGDKDGFNGLMAYCTSHVIQWLSTTVLYCVQKLRMQHLLVLYCDEDDD